MTQPRLRLRVEVADGLISRARLLRQTLRQAERSATEPRKLLNGRAGRAQFVSKISNPRLGEVNQGTIFTSAYAEDYNGCSVHGLIITARCDVSQNKVPIFNYLPVVSLDDWINRDGRVILSERALRHTQGVIGNQLKQAGFSPGILSVHPPRYAIETLFSEKEIDHKEQKKRDALLEQVSKFEHCQKTIESHPSERSVVDLANSFDGLKSVLLRELINQNLNGYYFIERTSPQTADLGHVILLREVRHVPRDLATEIGKGLDRETYLALLSSKHHWDGRLDFSREDFAMPVGCVTSPTIEHIMQNFSLLFSRIGVADPDPEYVVNIWDRLPSVDGREDK